MTAKITGILLAGLFGIAGATVAAQIRGPVPTLAPTIYSAPTLRHWRRRSIRAPQSSRRRGSRRC